MHSPIPFEDIVGTQLSDDVEARFKAAFGEPTEESDDEIRQISYFDSGLYIIVDRESERVTTCALFSRPGARWNGQAFGWDLPGAVGFGMSREELRSKLGAPVASNDKYRWDRWDLGSYLMRAGYTTDGRLVSIDLLAG